MNQTFPILEFDPSRDAIINPERVSKKVDVPEHCVICFFQEVISKLVQDKLAVRVARQFTEIGAHPVYKIANKGKPFALFHPGVTAPMCAALLEEVIARGCKKFIVCGSAGVLDSSIAMGKLIVPDAAIRDEGTSYHYIPPAREISANAEAVAAIEATLKARNIDYLRAKTWTTDGIFRETPDKIKMRKAEGCLTVEMEAAAFFAVAQFRGVTLGQILYGGDDVSGEEWDTRGWTKNNTIREKMFWLAAEACLRL